LRFARSARHRRREKRWPTSDEIGLDAPSRRDVIAQDRRKALPADISPPPAPGDSVQPAEKG